MLGRRFSGDAVLRLSEQGPPFGGSLVEHTIWLEVASSSKPHHIWPRQHGRSALNFRCWLLVAAPIGDQSSFFLIDTAPRMDPAL